MKNLDLLLTMKNRNFCVFYYHSISRNMGTKNQCLQDYLKANFENIFGVASPYDMFHQTMYALVKVKQIFTNFAG